MSSQHCNWRTVEAWRDLNVPLSTPSNEASKMYDAAVSQLSAHRDDPTVGGTMVAVEKMLTSDPEFVVGHAMKLGLQLGGGSATARNDPSLRTAVENLVTLADKQPHLAPAERKHVTAVKQLADGSAENQVERCVAMENLVTLADKEPHLTPAERKYVIAVKQLADGYYKEACATWEDILVDHPLDVLALKNAYLGYIVLGDSAQLRDSPARVLPRWSPHTPLYSFLLGMHAFGLEENNLFDRAEKQALKALELNRFDAWATHSMSHIFESTGRQDQGIAFLDSTRNDWERCSSLACHNWWHMSLHHIEKGDYGQALEVYENQVKTRCLKHREMFNVADAASLLFRLEMEGVKVKDKWRDIQDIVEKYKDRHGSVYYDLHLMFSCLGAGDKKAAQEMVESVEEFIRDGRGTMRDTHSRVGLKMCRALVAYKDGDFAQAADIVYPLRYDLYMLGGSHAQRDIFSLFLIMSALQSPKEEHHRQARALLEERKSIKENSPLTDRLLARALAMA